MRVIYHFNSVSTQFGAKGGSHGWESSDLVYLAHLPQILRDHGQEDGYYGFSKKRAFHTKFWSEIISMENRVIGFLRSHVYIKTESAKSNIYVASEKDFAKLNKSG
ncbi:unnamed protein product [Rangifer tarandus platyrhynchus]|uniref:Uncharacterized protein n=2 Tax=Rangifer tarandus platyrhynchus TaxID=3082113 RepID=A0ABN9A291_RANTA|nr:unnamed protein product [Rangifer tarandus platyrhynchus]